MPPLDYVGVLLSFSNVGWVSQVPIFGAVFDQAVIKGVMEISLDILEVSVAVAVGFLICSHVRDNHLRLC